jgi:mono/diheme cytochrome c family protein
MRCCLNLVAFVGGLLLLLGCVTNRSAAAKRNYLQPLAAVAVNEYVKGKKVANIVVPFDPVYKKRKEYRGVSTEDLWLQLAGSSKGTPLTVLFRCSDGYSPVRDFSALTNQPSFIAFEDESGLPVKWELLPGGQTPAPYYLVWLGEMKSEKLPWPYQLEAVEIYDSRQFKRITDGQSRSARGRRLFLENCISCHQIRGVGGSISVDLAYPHKVTDYWNRGFLKALILDPATVRSSAKMPKLGLQQSDAEDIIRYLEDL